MASVRVLLGRRIRSLREAQGFSQESFAERCRLHRTYVGGIERGERNVSLDNLVKIASALGVSLSLLMSFSPANRPSKLALRVSRPRKTRLRHVRRVD